MTIFSVSHFTLNSPDIENQNCTSKTHSAPHLTWHNCAPLRERGGAQKFTRQCRRETPWATPLFKPFRHLCQCSDIRGATHEDETRQS